MTDDLLEKRKSYYSKEAISNLVLEMINYYKVDNKEIIINHLFDNGFINNSILDILNEHKIEKCHAVIKKGRCNNKILHRGSKFCNYHISLPSQTTIEEHNNVKKLNT